MNTTVGGFKTEQVGLYKRVDVLAGDYSTTVHAGNRLITASQNIALSAGDGGAKITMSADSITLVVGDSSIELKKNGDITLSGVTLKQAFSSKIVDASGEIHEN
jgi:hypothetical protein